jgi:hypothetical protein
VRSLAHVHMKWEVAEMYERQEWLKDDEHIVWNGKARFSIRLAALGSAGVLMVLFAAYLALQDNLIWGLLFFIAFPTLVLPVAGLFTRNSSYYLTNRRIAVKRSGILRWYVPLQLIDRVSITDLSVIGIATLHFWHDPKNEADWALVQGSGRYSMHSNWLTWSLMRPDDARKAKRLILDAFDNVHSYGGENPSSKPS